MKNANEPAAIGLRIYRTLANAFPQEFKNAYGDELIQVTEEAIGGIWRRDGFGGLFALLLDVVARVVWEHLFELKQDIRYGLRMLAGARGFTATALISLGIGICIATSAYSELHSMVLPDTPGVRKPDQLVAAQLPVSYPRFERFQSQTGVFASALAYVAPVPFAISEGGHTDRFWGQLVTASYFSTLGVQPLLGRFFEASESRPGKTPETNRQMRWA